MLSRLLALGSLALCLALGVLWTLGLFAGRTLRITTEAFTHDADFPNEERHVVTIWYLQSADSGLALARLRLDGPGSVPRMHGHTMPAASKFDHLTHRPPRDLADVWTTGRTPPPPEAGSSRRFGPFFARRERRTALWSPGADGVPMLKQVTEFAAGLPTAIPFVLSAVLPLRLAARARRRARLLREGRCLQCGYDVRATPERCPECGAAVAAGSHPSRTSFSTAGEP